MLVDQFKLEQARKLAEIAQWATGTHQKLTALIEAIRQDGNAGPNVRALLESWVKP